MGYGYVPITVTNNESSATSTNFQQLVTVDLSYYSSFLNADLSNTFFSSDTAGSTVLNSWLESGNTYPFTSVNFWVVLPDGIAANSSATIYLQVDLSNANHFNTTTTGEAPQLSSTYAEYDDGANVFNFYDNFAGTSLNTSKWTVEAGTAPTINNGATFTATGLAMDSASKYPNQILETYSDVTTAGNGGFGYTLDISGNQYTDAEYLAIGSTAGYVYNGVSDGMSNPDSGTNVGVLNGADTTFSYVAPSGFAIYGILWTSSSVQTLVNYASTGSETADIPAAGDYYIFFANSGGGWTTQWIRARAYPPNGVMPSISTSNPVNFPYINTSTNEDLF